LALIQIPILSADTVTDTEFWSQTKPYQFKIQFQFQNSKFKIQNSRFKIQDSKFKIQRNSKKFKKIQKKSKKFKIQILGLRSR